MSWSCSRSCLDGGLGEGWKTQNLWITAIGPWGFPTPHREVRGILPGMRPGRMIPWPRTHDHSGRRDHESRTPGWPLRNRRTDQVAALAAEMRRAIQALFDQDGVL